MDSFYGNDSHLSLAEFDPPSPLTQVYVPQLTDNEYEDQGASETEKALTDLIDYMEENTDAYAKILKRRKFDEKESGGIMSLLKVRLLKKMRGEEYMNNIVSQDEVQQKLDEVKTGMMMAYNYAQESKGRRCSRRLAMKKAREQQLQGEKENAENIPVTGAGAGVPPPPPPPPPPPCPPPTSMPPPPPPPPVTSIALNTVVLTPLKDNKNIMSSTPFPDPKQKLFRTDSMSSLTSLHSELTMTNPLKRLRTTQIARSPGGTPMSPLARRPLRPSLLDTPNALNRSESLSSVFFRIMESKFRNVRSPSPCTTGNNTVASPSEFDISP